MAQAKPKRRSRKRHTPRPAGRAATLEHRDPPRSARQALARPPQRDAGPLKPYGDPPPNRFGGVPVSEIAILVGAIGFVAGLIDSAGVTIRDHGSGIAEQDLPHVFDRFYRGANARGSQGSGLGLAIVRQVAEQHGGSVSAANAPDGGAIFTLHLPASPSAAPDAATESYDLGGLASRA